MPQSQLRPPPLETTGAAIAHPRHHDARRQNLRLLVVGPRGAGKTAVLAEFGHGATTLPARGFPVESVECRNMSLIAWNTGLEKKRAPLSSHIYETVHGRIYVADSTNRERIGFARDEIARLVRDRDWRDTVLLVLANMQDLPNAMTVMEVAEGLGLHNVWHKQWSIQGACTRTGNGVLEGLDWLEEALMSAEAS